MFKIAVAFLALTSTAFAFDPKIKTEMLDPTVQVNQDCSGTVVYSDRDEVSGKVRTLILSAGHCIEGREETLFEIRMPEIDTSTRIVKEDVYKAVAVGKYYKGDLSLIELLDKDTLFQNVAKIADSDVHLDIGENVWSVGFPFGLNKTITQGLFGGFQDFLIDKENILFYRATPDIAGGNSGGGLWHQTASGDYELIGVNVRASQQAPFITLQVPVSMVNDYLKVALRK